MNDKYSKIHETTLYEIWKRQSYNSTLKTSSGEEIKILDVGVHNQESAGPDFKNARIRIGNLTYVGDIEIDNEYTDWKSHGHNIDNRYNKVILHASLVNPHNYGHVYTRDGRKVNSICFSEFVEESNLENIKRETNKEKRESISKIKCSECIDQADDNLKIEYLRKMGIARFEKKCKKIFERLKELQFIEELKIKEPVLGYELTSKFHERKFQHTDFGSKDIWNQLLYELIFEALGYSKNKSQMLNLARYANINFLGRIEKDGVLTEKYEAALLFISGIAHNSSSSGDLAAKKYIEKISLHWNSINTFYDGKYFEETYWHFFRLRPQNFPTVRMAGGARLLKELLHNNLISVMAKKITEIHNLTVLSSSLRSIFVVRADGFWKNHYILNQPSGSEIKYFVGAGRADEIVVNVVLPFFAIYFDIFANHDSSRKIIRLYNIYQQRAENQIINEVARGLNLSSHTSTSVIAQGMIELFRNYCSRNKCLECDIGKAVFN